MKPTWTQARALRSSPKGRISPMRSIHQFGEVREQFDLVEAKRYNTIRRAGRHSFGSRSFEFQRDGRRPLGARKTLWRNLQSALQRVAKAGRPTCEAAAQRNHWMGLMLDSGMDPSEVKRIAAKTWEGGQ